MNNFPISNMRRILSNRTKKSTSSGRNMSVPSTWISQTFLLEHVGASACVCSQSAKLGSSFRTATQPHITTLLKRPSHRSPGSHQVELPTFGFGVLHPFTTESLRHPTWRPLSARLAEGKKKGAMGVCDVFRLVSLLCDHLQHAWSLGLSYPHSSNLTTPWLISQVS